MSKSPIRTSLVVIPAKAGIQMKMHKNPCVYMLASRRNGTLYVGVTSNLPKRIWEHKNDVVEGFTRRYGVHTLVWCELHATMESAIEREKAIKEWKRRWKLDLIERVNPDWRDLYDDIAIP
jgi:putative endonuclease